MALDTPVIDQVFMAEIIEFALGALETYHGLVALTGRTAFWARQTF